MMMNHNEPSISVSSDPVGHSCQRLRATLLYILLLGGSSGRFHPSTFYSSVQSIGGQAVMKGWLKTRCNPNKKCEYMYYVFDSVVVEGNEEDDSSTYLRGPSRLEGLDRRPKNFAKRC